MPNYKVSFTTKVNEIIPDRSLENNTVVKIEKHEMVFEIDYDTFNFSDPILEKKIKEKISYINEFHNIISIERK